MKYTIKAEDFQYPSKEERKLISRTYPKMKKFRFPYVSELDALTDAKPNLKMLNRAKNLYGWDECLQGKLWNLYQSYINTITQYNRGIPDGEHISYNESNIVNRIQYGFYVETFYYTLSSVTDVLFQIVNVFMELGLSENGVSWKTLNKKLAEGDLKTTLTSFQTAMHDSYQIRNSITHRYPLIRPDNRTTLTVEDGRNVLSFKWGMYSTPIEIRENITKSLEHLALLLIDLKQHILV